MPKKKDRTFAAKLAHETRTVHVEICKVCGKEKQSIVHLACSCGDPAHGAPRGAGSRSATATAKKSTDKRRKAVSGLQGVLLLTAGFGRRAEPLSLFRPKALLPFREKTLLGCSPGKQPF
jgi:hypothetical protein